MPKCFSVRFSALLILLLLTLPLSEMMAEDTTEPPKLRTEQLLEIQVALDVAKTRLQTLKKATAKTSPEQDPGLFADLVKQNEEVMQLEQAFEKTASSGLSRQALNDEEPAFNWQQEMVGITQPVIESLKSLTNKPRERAELRTTIKRIDSQQQLLQKGLLSIEREVAAAEEPQLKKSIETLQQEWQQQLADLAREKMVTEGQLVALDEEKSDWQEILRQTAISFFTGHALTLFIAIIAAVAVWLFFRLLNRHIWTRQAGLRSSPLYRFLMYSFHVFSTIFVIFTLFAVFYLRDDILLLGLGVIMMIGALIGLQRTLPRFLKEVNLLLNLGSAREGERVIFNGVPYHVQSLNVFTTLVNPALSGMQRLPLEQVGSLNSRPELDDESWFPTDAGDALLMPDGKLVCVEQQSVEQVTLKMVSGTQIQYNTADFYSLDVENLTRNGVFGVSTVFGLDYRYQDKILSDYPELIRTEVPQALQDAGFDPGLCRSVGAELKVASASSLDILVWASFDSQLAMSVKKLERILQHACVRVCNRHGLNIPFPQLSIHMENNTQGEVLPLGEPV